MQYYSGSLAEPSFRQEKGLPQASAPAALPSSTASLLYSVTGCVCAGARLPESPDARSLLLYWLLCEQREPGSSLPRGVKQYYWTRGSQTKGRGAAFVALSCRQSHCRKWSDALRLSVNARLFVVMPVMQ
jgi:hypothetical protein